MIFTLRNPKLGTSEIHHPISISLNLNTKIIQIKFSFKRAVEGEILEISAVEPTILEAVSGG